MLISSCELHCLKKPTWKLKHANSNSRDFRIIPPIDPYNLELYRFKNGPFFETQCSISVALTAVGSRGNNLPALLRHRASACKTAISITASQIRTRPICISNPHALALYTGAVMRVQQLGTTLSIIGHSRRDSGISVLNTVQSGIVRHHSLIATTDGGLTLQLKI